MKCKALCRPWSRNIQILNARLGKLPGQLSHLTLARPPSAGPTGIPPTQSIIYVWMEAPADTIGRAAAILSSTRQCSLSNFDLATSSSSHQLSSPMRTFQSHQARHASESPHTALAPFAALSPRDFVHKRHGKRKLRKQRRHTMPKQKTDGQRAVQCSKRFQNCLVDTKYALYIQLSLS